MPSQGTLAGARKPLRSWSLRHWLDVDPVPSAGLRLCVLSSYQQRQQILQASFWGYEKYFPRIRDSSELAHQCVQIPSAQLDL